VSESVVSHFSHLFLFPLFSARRSDRGLTGAWRERGEERVRERGEEREREARSSSLGYIFFIFVHPLWF